jgi:hypothetical protein
MVTNLYFKIKINVQVFCLLLAKKCSFFIQIGLFLVKDVRSTGMQPGMFLKIL